MRIVGLFLSALVGCGGIVRITEGGGAATKSEAGPAPIEAAPPAGDVAQPPVDVAPPPVDVAPPRGCSPPCGPRTFCTYADRRCGDGLPTGTCREIPVGCGPNYACGCDGKTYVHACEAYAAGVDLRTTGGCPAPPDRIACGAFFCEAYETCVVGIGDDPHKPLDHHCLRTGCSTCRCLPKDFPCRDTCVEVAPGGLRLTCPAQ